jgi:hypothetical protein
MTLLLMLGAYALIGFGAAIFGLCLIWGPRR